MNNFADMIKEMIKAWLLGFDTKINASVTILTEDWWVSGNAWYDFAISVQSVVKPIATSILIIFFLIEFIKITINLEVVKWEYLFKCFFKYCIAIYAMNMASYLMSAIYATGNSWVSHIGTTGSTVGSDVWTSLETVINGYNFWKVLGLFISTGMMMLVINAVGLLVNVMAYARKFEVVMLTCIAPLPCAFIPTEDAQFGRVAKKFFMNFGAVSLQGVFMIASIKLYGILVGEAVNTVIANPSASTTDLINAMLLGSITLVIAITKSSGWAKSVLDAM